MRLKQSSASAFTLTEMLVTVAIMAILVGFAIPGLNAAKKEAQQTQINANLRNLNMFASQMRSAGITNVGSSGNDKEAALNFYLQRGFIQGGKRPEIGNLKFEDGIWRPND
jgi:prepilin-type N-terminal cleavage/methylation domain-containing protein